MHGKSYNIYQSIHKQKLVKTRSLVDCNLDWSLRIEKGILLVQNDRIILRASVSDLSSILEKYQIEKEAVINLTDTQFLLPGLIDSHIHASQFPNAGKNRFDFIFIIALITCIRSCS